MESVIGIKSVGSTLRHHVMFGIVYLFWFQSDLYNKAQFYITLLGKFCVMIGWHDVWGHQLASL